MNAYADVVTFKSPEYAAITDKTEQVRFRKLLENASRYLDKRCGRHFYCKEETRYFDGADRQLVIDDLLSLTTIKTDEDGDGVFENTLASTDYFIYPLNGYPKYWLEINPNGDYSSFATGIQKGVEIVGVWGYGDSATPYADAGTDVNGAVAAADTTITVDDGSVFGAGMTIRIDNEQIYIESIEAHVLTVQRGVNGTTAATHANDSDIYIYEYPMPIYQACLVIAMRAWKRKDSAFQDAVGNAETGLVVTYKDEDPSVRRDISLYKRMVL
jgi:hypothetical protein